MFMHIKQKVGLDPQTILLTGSDDTGRNQIAPVKA